MRNIKRLNILFSIILLLTLSNLNSNDDIKELNINEIFKPKNISKTIKRKDSKDNLDLKNKVIKFIKSDFGKAVIAGAISQAAVEGIRNHLSEAKYLYSIFGICRDRLTGIASVTAALVGLEKTKSKSKDYKTRLYGVLTGILSTTILSKIILKDLYKLLA